MRRSGGSLSTWQHQVMKQQIRTSPKSHWASHVARASISEASGIEKTIAILATPWGQSVGVLAGLSPSAMCCVLLLPVAFLLLTVAVCRLLSVTLTFWLLAVACGPWLVLKGGAAWLTTMDCFGMSRLQQQQLLCLKSPTRPHCLADLKVSPVIGTSCVGAAGALPPWHEAPKV